MTTLFVALQNSESKSWLPVARLTKEDALYRFSYTSGAKGIPGFNGFSLLANLDKEYVSEELFPIFANRVLSESRPEYKDYINWLGLDEKYANKMSELALTGGIRATDKVELFPFPEPTDEGTYKVVFFSRGLSHMYTDNQLRANSLSSEEQLFVMKDIQNDYDEMAILLRTSDPVSLVGYLPRYYSADVSKLIDLVGVENVSVKVKKVNRDAPLQYRVLCSLEATWPEEFMPFSTCEYKVLADSRRNPSIVNALKNSSS